MQSYSIATGLLLTADCAADREGLNCLLSLPGVPMDKIVSAADANRRFSKLLRDVRDGDSYVVTAHGRPVAKIIPIRGDDVVRDKARELLLARLRSQPAIDIGPWTREELYEDGR